MKRFWSVAVALGLILGLLAGCSQPAPQEPGQQSPPTQSEQPGSPQDTGPIKLGIVVPLTTPVATAGLEQRQGAELAIAEINAAGGVLGGRQLVAVAEDSQNNNTAAINAFEKVANEKPAAIVGSVLGTQMVAMDPLIRQYKIPTLTVSGTRKVTQLGNPYIFRFYPHDGISKVAQVRFALEKLGAKKPALLHTEDEYGQSGRDIILAELERAGIEPVVIESAADSDKDLTVQLTKIRDSGADVLLIQLQSGNSIAAMKQISQLGLTIPVVANNTFSNPAVLANVTPTDVKGFYMETGIVTTATADPEVKAFVDNYESKYGRKPAHFAILTYDSVKTLAQAINDAGSTDPDAIANALRGVSYDGLVTTYKSDAEGNLNLTSILYQHTGEGSEFAFEEVFRVTVDDTK